MQASPLFVVSSGTGSANDPSTNETQQSLKLAKFIHSTSWKIRNQKSNTTIIPPLGSLYFFVERWKKKQEIQELAELHCHCQNAFAAILR
mmetsp:Transcript_45568/g.97723  ORF Transcript_45568/g.97723 Transcript_45568/m.97723 type:complete len:90 (-) Transcript_45568:2137-2406(-)